jgi:hypothetical protein
MGHLRMALSSFAGKKQRRQAGKGETLSQGGAWTHGSCGSRDVAARSVPAASRRNMRVTSLILYVASELVWLVSMNLNTAIIASCSLGDNVRCHMFMGSESSVLSGAS